MYIDPVMSYQPTEHTIEPLQYRIGDFAIDIIDTRHNDIHLYFNFTLILNRSKSYIVQ